MKGGEESWGATGMPPQFYDPKAPLASFPSNSGKGAKSAYGAIQPFRRRYRYVSTFYCF